VALFTVLPLLTLILAVLFARLPLWLAAGTGFVVSLVAWTLPFEAGLSSVVHPTLKGFLLSENQERRLIGVVALPCFLYVTAVLGIGLLWHYWVS
jgi:hypothetical protein